MPTKTKPVRLADHTEHVTDFRCPLCESRVTAWKRPDMDSHEIGREGHVTCGHFVVSLTVALSEHTGAWRDSKKRSVLRENERGMIPTLG